MSMRSADIMDQGSNAQAGAFSLLRTIGGWGTAGGPSMFMIRTIIFGATSAVFFGLTGGMLGSIIYGTASLPFLAFSSVGFVLGVTHWYRASVMQALLHLEAYPALLRLHLDSNYPTVGFRRMPLEAFRRREFGENWRMQSMLVAAWLTAQPAIDEIHTNEEQTLVAEASQVGVDVTGEEGK